MPFRRANDVALKRVGGKVVITPPDGEARECLGLYELSYDDEHSGDANVRRPEPVVTISEEAQVDLTRGATVECWHRDGSKVGTFTLQRAQPDDAGMIRIELRAAKT